VAYPADCGGFADNDYLGFKEGVEMRYFWGLLCFLWMIIVGLKFIQTGIIDTAALACMFATLALAEIESDRFTK
jgi:hypothetical protein